MSITIKLNKIKTLETTIRDFLARKSNLEVKIRSLECNDIDICKDLLLEEYFSGMLIVLEILGFLYNVDEKQVGFSIDTSKFKEEILCTEQIEKACNVLKVQVFEQYEIIKNIDFKKDDYDSLIKIEGKFYVLLGMLIAFNKLNIGFNIKSFFNLDKSVLEKLKGKLIIDDTTAKNNLLTEPETYKYLNDEINLLDSRLFDILSINKIIKYQKFEKKILENRKKLLKIAIEDNENNEISDRVDKEAEKQRQSEYKIKNLEDELENKCKNQIVEIENFINKYFSKGI